MRPIVLMTPDVEERPLRRGPTPYHAFEKCYGEAVLAAGGLPWVAPYTEAEDALDGYVAHAQAVVLTGGDFDIDPSLFGEAPHPALGTLKPDRTAFERAIYERAMARGLPILGICGGMQLVCALRGGTLWQDLDTQHPSDIDHQQVAIKAEPGHPVDVVVGTRLAAICGAGELGVNSTHHQAVRALPDDLVASAIAPDGIIEAFEDPNVPFLVGVQWHPEAMPHERQQALYRALVAAAAGGG
jgi:putative glutamine amidotransferase